MQIHIKGKRKEVIIEIESKKNPKRDKLKRQIRNARIIALASVGKQLTAGHTYSAAATVGIVQGMKYGGNFKRGIKAGLVTVGVLCTVNAVANVADKWEDIKNS